MAVDGLQQETGQADNITESRTDMCLEYLIDHEMWDEAYEKFQDCPDEAKRIVDPSSRLGWMFLHWLSSMPDSPDVLLELVASLNPFAITTPDRRYGDTPLHIVCRNSITSCEKVHILLRYCPKDENSNHKAVLTRNVFGGTALHSACNHNAMLGALQALVHANPLILKVRTHEGMHAISALMMSYMQTIPGTMTVARLLSGRTENNNTLFERFWKKAEFLSTEYYFLTQSAETLSEAIDDSVCRKYVLHGLIRCDAPINLFKLALKVNPDYARAVDTNGNLPLHVLVESRPYRLKEKEAIVATLQAAPETASVHNKIGDVPLTIGIRNKIPWENGLDEVVLAGMCVAGQRDRITGLYPFQLAATQDGRVAVETTYQLLCMRPDLVSS